MISTQANSCSHSYFNQRANSYATVLDAEYPLHYCAFFGLRDRLTEVLANISPDEVNKQDCYGNTALHIAIMLGHRECAEILLEAKCNIFVRNLEGWNALSEAISYGSNSLTTKLYRIMRSQIVDREKIRQFDQALRTIPDCQMDFQWEIVSWMPFISKILPSDVCRLRKIGSCLRLDTSLVDISGWNSTRGDLSVIFNPGARIPMLILNHKKKTYYSIGFKQTHVENDVHVLRNTELLHMRLSLDKMVCAQTEARQHARWSSTIGETMIGKYHTTTYTLNNMCFKTTKRLEHLKERHRHSHHRRRSKAESSCDSEKPSKSSLRSNSLSPPRGHKTQLIPNECNSARVSWETYRSGLLKPLETYLGRKPELKKSEKRFKLTVAMTDQIPISVTQLLDMLQVISPLSKFNKLRKALQTGLPEGFPVRLEMPLVPTTLGRVVFNDVKLLNASGTQYEMEKQTDYDSDVVQSTLIGPSQHTDLFVVPPEYRYAGEFHLSKPAGKRTKVHV